jgi:hypothetical protein
MDWINGTIPLETPGGLHWIKITDVNPNIGGDNIPSSDIAVSVNRINVWPQIIVTPESGPAGLDAMVEGRAFAANGLVNVSVGIDNWSLSGPAYGFASTGYTSRNVTAGDLGEFTRSFTELGLVKGAPDYHMEVGMDDASASQLINVSGYDYDSSNGASDTYDLMGRQFEAVFTYTSAGGVFDSAPASSGPYGSEPSGVNPVNVQAEVFGVVEINGSYFNVWDGLSFIWDYDTDDPVELDPVFTVPMNEDGHFNASVSVPISTAAPHMLAVVDETWSWNMTIDVQRTLIVDPHQVYIGDTVTVEGYGFDAEERMDLWYWNYNDYTGDAIINFASTPSYGFMYGTTSFSDDYWENLTAQANVNITTDSRGFFSLSFQVSHNHGGDHAVVAYERSSYNISSEDTLTDWGIGGLTIKPKMILINGTSLMVDCVAPNYDEIWDDEANEGMGTMHFTSDMFLAPGVEVKAGTLLLAWVQGIPVGSDSSYAEYTDGWYFKGEWSGYEGNSWTFTYDNVRMPPANQGWNLYQGYVKGNVTGDAIYGFFAVGAYSAHVVGFYGYPGWPGALSEGSGRGFGSLPLTWAQFNIAGPSADTEMILDEMDTMQENLLAEINSLFETTWSFLEDKFDATWSVLGDIQADVTSSFEATWAVMEDKFDATWSVLGDIQEDIGSVKSDVSSVSSDLDDVSTDISASADTLSSVAGELGNSITYMYVLLALVVITLVLELVILLRKRA